MIIMPRPVARSTELAIGVITDVDLDTYFLLDETYHENTAVNITVTESPDSVGLEIDYGSGWVDLAAATDQGGGTWLAYITVDTASLDVEIRAKAVYGATTVYSDVIPGQTTTIRQWVSDYDGFEIDMDSAVHTIADSAYITNGTFDDATNWTLPASWSVSGGTLNHSNTSLETAVETVGSLINGHAYVIRGTLVSTNGGVTYLRLGSTATPTRTVAGTYDAFAHANSTTVSVYGAAAFAGSWDDLSIAQSCSISETTQTAAGTTHAAGIWRQTTGSRRPWKYETLGGRQALSFRTTDSMVPSLAVGDFLFLHYDPAYWFAPFDVFFVFQTDGLSPENVVFSTTTTTAGVYFGVTQAGAFFAAIVHANGSAVVYATSSDGVVAAGTPHGAHVRCDSNWNILSLRLNGLFVGMKGCSGAVSSSNPGGIALGNRTVNGSTTDIGGSIGYFAVTKGNVPLAHAENWARVLVERFVITAYDPMMLLQGADGLWADMDAEVAIVFPEAQPDIADRYMEISGTGEWASSGATISKSSTEVYQGTYGLYANPTSDPWFVRPVSPGSLTIGYTYLATVRARSTMSTNRPVLSLDGTTHTGSASTSWQHLRMRKTIVGAGSVRLSNDGRVASAFDVLELDLITVEAVTCKGNMGGLVTSSTISTKPTCESPRELDSYVLLSRRQYLEFAAAQYIYSESPASDWNLHHAEGFSLFFVYRQHAYGSNEVLFQTTTTSTGNGIRVWIESATYRVYVSVGNGVSTIATDYGALNGVGSDIERVGITWSESAGLKIWVSSDAPRSSATSGSSSTADADMTLQLSNATTTCRLTNILVRKGVLSTAQVEAHMAWVGSYYPGIH